jgi:hypothetical protein
MVGSPMRSAVFSLVLLVGCSVDTYGLGVDEVEVGGELDSSATDSSIGDDTKPLFDADDDSTTIDSGTDSGMGDTAKDSGAIAIDSALVVDSALDAPPDVEIDSGVDTGSDSGADSEMDTFEAGPTDTGTVSPFIPSAGAVTCTDGMGGTKLCAAGQVCCGTSGGYSCKSSCSDFDKDYRCDETADCSGGQICCVKVSIIGTPEGSDCRESWLCIGPRLCQTDAECGAGKMCVPYKPSGAPYTMGRCP